MGYKEEYKRWLENTSGDVLEELKKMDETAIEDAFYQNLEFGTGGMRGTMGAGTNRLNVYMVAKASQGLANYLGSGASVVIAYDSRINSERFAKTTASVLAANGITVCIWPDISPVPTVSYGVRALHASAGVMITASHNPASDNGYKVYGSDGCQITTETAKSILNKINAMDIFEDVRYFDYDKGLQSGRIQHITPEVLDAFLEDVKNQSVLFGDEIQKDVAIVYSPLNGTGLIPVTRVLSETGFTNITVVEEQRNPDGTFPTCPYPNPEIREAMELGLEYCRKTGADLLLATDPDCDRVGIAVRAGSDYQLLTGNEVGLLLLDYICSQRVKHGRMPDHPVFVKTIVTMDMAEKIAAHYGVETINVLTGFKFIGEVIGRLEASGREKDFIFGFEESYGYLSGSYVRDKDGVGASFLICEMFAFYKTRGICLIDKLNELYKTYGYCLNTLHSYKFPGSTGMAKMKEIMSSLRNEANQGTMTIGGMEVERTEDYLPGLNGLPKSNVLKFFTRKGSIVIRPSGTEPKLKIYISVMAEDRAEASKIEDEVRREMEKRFA